MADVIVNLHGDEHRSRRRLENRLFRRDRMEDYEKRRFPEVIEETIAPHVEAGGCELVHLSHQLMMNLAATTAGIDRPLGTPEETFHLYDYLMTFIEGATLAHYTGDKDAKAAEVAAQLEEFDAEFLTPSIARRRRAIEAAAAGEIDQSEVPVDVLTTLLRNEDDLELPHETIRRETAFYLLAGAHTSATAFVRTLHRLFSWEAEHPEERDVIRTDPIAVQRCMHETIRLEPSSPVAMRWVLEDIELRAGTKMPKGAKVVIDLTSVNRDPAVFGDDAEDFNPHRELADGVSPWGLSFGNGHARLHRPGPGRRTALRGGRRLRGTPPRPGAGGGAVDAQPRSPTRSPDAPAGDGHHHREALLGQLPGPVRLSGGATAAGHRADPAVLDLHAHVVLEGVLGRAGAYGPELTDDPECPTFRVGGYTLEGVRYRGSAFMDLGRCGWRPWTRSASPGPAALTQPADLPAPHRARTAGGVRPLAQRRDGRARGPPPRPPVGLGAAADAGPGPRRSSCAGPWGSWVCVAAYVGTDVGHDEVVALDDPTMDELWATAVDLDVPVFLHPAPPGIDHPLTDPRLRRFDADLWLSVRLRGDAGHRHAGVRWRARPPPRPRVCVSHGGGALGGADRQAPQVVARRPWVPEAPPLSRGDRGTGSAGSGTTPTSAIPGCWPCWSPSSARTAGGRHQPRRAGTSPPSFPDPGGEPAWTPTPDGLLHLRPVAPVASWLRCSTRVAGSSWSTMAPEGQRRAAVSSAIVVEFRGARQHDGQLVVVEAERAGVVRHALAGAHALVGVDLHPVAHVVVLLRRLRAVMLPALRTRSGSRARGQHRLDVVRDDLLVGVVVAVRLVAGDVVEVRDGGDIGVAVGEAGVGRGRSCAPGGCGRGAWRGPRGWRPGRPRSRTAGARATRCGGSCRAG